MDLLAWLLISVTIVYVSVALAFTWGLSRTRPTTPGTVHPFVSVVIAARNEETNIARCLDGLLRQTYPPECFEVLVVDDGSEDATRDIVGRIAERNARVRCLEVGDLAPEMAAKKRPLSVGIREARGEIILTTDADCRVLPTWISQMVACFGPDVGAVIGFSQVKEYGQVSTLLERYQGFDFLALMSAASGAANLSYPLAATGQNLAYRKSLFESVGGFREIRNWPSGDDILLLQLMRRAGGKQIVFANHPATFVSTWRTESLRGYLQQRRRWASNARFQARLNRPFFAYIVDVFLVNTLVPLGVIFGSPAGVRMVALACWAVKACSDFVLAWRGACKFRRQDLLRVFPLWELFQSPYILAMGILGTLSGFTWKGRRYRPSER
jgi:cellulose synthase/poly-beta-1,6-N-acetylglucosamine synthase-like glycosyltransferase